MFITFLSSENKANDQKKLKKMVEELANKYGKTEDEIFYAYDQWVFFRLNQKLLFFSFFVWKRTLIQTCKSISSGSWRNIQQESSRRSSSLTRWGWSIRKQKNVDNVEKMMAIIVVTQGGILCDSVYGMFDEDNSGSMDFQENMTVILTITLSQCWWYEGKRALKEVKCIQAKFAMMMSTPEEKLSWIFEIFDSDGGGKKNRWKVTKWFAFPPLGPSSSVKQGSRTWQPFVAN